MGPELIGGSPEEGRLGLGLELGLGLGLGLELGLGLGLELGLGQRSAAGVRLRRGVRQRRRTPAASCSVRARTADGPPSRSAATSAEPTMTASANPAT